MNFHIGKLDFWPDVDVCSPQIVWEVPKISQPLRSAYVTASGFRIFLANYLFMLSLCNSL